MNGTQENARQFAPGCWIGWLLAAIFVAAAIWLGHRTLWLQGQLVTAEGSSARLAVKLNHANEVIDVLTLPQAKHVVLTEARGPLRPSGQVSWLASEGALVFVGGGLKPLPVSRSYELWMVPEDSKAPIPAGLFRPNADGSASVVLPPLPANTQARKFMVTMEPAKGSATPSLPIVIQGEPAMRPVRRH